jgi:hypothetical protein
VELDSRSLSALATGRACEWGVRLARIEYGLVDNEVAEPPSREPPCMEWRGRAITLRTTRDGDEELSVLPAGLWVGCGESCRMTAKGHAGTEESVEFLGGGLVLRA